MSHNASVLTAQNVPLEIQKRDIPSPGPHQLLVRNHAIALNPVDNMMQETGYFVQHYPVILGTDVSGTVEAIGPDVTKFKKGDRVAGYAMAIGTGDPNEGAYQEYSLLQDNATTKITDRITYEEGATLPMAVATAGVAIFLRQNVPRAVSASPQPGIYLVWGASASIGTAAVQIARRIGFTVFATASPQHHDYIKKLGATEVFDYHDPKVVETIVAAAKAAGKTITHCFTAVTAGGAAPLAAKVLAHFTGGSAGPIKLCTSLAWPENEKLPEGIELTQTLAFVIGLENKEFGTWLFNEFLGGALESGEYVPSPEPEVVEGGLSGLPAAMAKLKAGVSAKKVMVTV
ncbi:putative alcohol dehydrogenase [Xylogone sp. PMI_703]|nr:putative alcohol dehydrogenase [Xylogone sp. PMI_703]